MNKASIRYNRISIYQEHLNPGALSCSLITKCYLPVSSSQQIVAEVSKDAFTGLSTLFIVSELFLHRRVMSDVVAMC